MRSEASDARQGAMTPGAVGGELRLIVFRLEDEAFGLPLEVVEEVARGSGLGAQPEADPPIRGEVVVRGVAVPVLDLRQGLGMEPMPGPERGRILVASLPGSGRVGLLVDSVDGVRSVPRAALVPVPRFFRHASACVRGVARDGGELIVVLDPAGLRPGGRPGSRVEEGAR
jgi:purine-binding chemotaxis protein CheW